MARPQVARAAIPAFVVGLVVGGCAVWLLATTGLLERPNVATQTAEPTVAAEPPTDSSYDPETVEIEYEVVTDGMSVTHLPYVYLVSLSVTEMGAATSTTTKGGGP